ncbi:hypothetical protein BJY01DRAFT_91909 [Aspergillus pseudoustus]|uniref:Chromo domain-containing protein n=1 Tax=Aspergillus pseudoustus TaxID=1810923 RepID=A0ABR4KJS2_9EURO
MAMGSVSDDEISLTSTAESDQQSEYEVKTILSEHQFPDGTRYLVEWAGYPIERCTWEPADAFDFDETLLDWEKKRRQIADGKLSEFDVAGWEARIIRLNEEREERRRRRAAKRRKISLSESSRGNQVVPNKERPSIHQASSASVPPPLASNPDSTSRGANPPRHGPAARKLPPVLFATTQKAPAPSRPKKTPSTETHKHYTLSWKHKFEKRAQRDRAPDISQLDLRRPSDWTPVTSANAFQLSNSRRGPVPAESVRGSPMDSDRPGSLLSSPILNQHIRASPVSPPRSNEAFRETSKLEVNDSVHPSRTSFVFSDGSRNMDSECLPEIPPRKPGPHAIIIQRNRFWNPGELYVSMYFGPDKEDIGNARLCGMDYAQSTRIFKTKVGKKIEIWFRYLCTLDEYQVLCDRSRNIKHANGWIEGFDDTEPKIHMIAETLQQDNLLTIAQINNRDGDVLLAYLPRSTVFGFLDATPGRPGQGYLRLALRSYLGPLDGLNRRPTINRQQMTSPGINSQSGYFKSMKVNRSVSAKQSDKPNVAQENTNLALNSPTLQIQHSATLLPSPVVNKPGAHKLTPLEPRGTENIDQLMSEPMNLSIKDAQVPSPGHAQAPSSAEVSWDDEFSKRFDITFDDLATLGAAVKGQKADMFYVWFPDNSEMVRRERDAIESFLKPHTGLLYSNRVEGDWEKFVATSKKANMPGAILFHESFIGYHKVPSLRELLRRSVTGCWNISLSQPLQYVGQSVHKQRLFPHGGVFLITEDFMLGRLEGTLTILAWFHEWLQKKFPGNWKLMVRPGVQNWALKQAEISDDSQQHKWLAMYHLLEQLGVSASDDPSFENDYIKTFVISPPTLPMYGSRTAEGSPDVPRDASQEYRDTDHLAEFFAGWTLVHAHRFRRFVMLTTLEPIPRWTQWQHIEIRRGSNDFFAAWSIDPNAVWSKLTKGASKSASHSAPLPTYTPRTPRPPAGSTSEQRHTSSASHSQAPAEHKYAQPYQ